ncbi:MAG: thioredoxin domain-containing protein [Nanoarchaeota archaeon]|nr:thioredoxin domain-containing protein [Nanoarchaeota archaeon]
MVRLKTWKYTTYILLLIIIVGLYSYGLPSFSGVSASTDSSEVADTAVSYINSELLAGGLGEAELVSVSEENGLYKLALEITYSNGLTEDYTSYVTLDGEVLFPTAIPMEASADTVDDAVDDTTDDTTDDSNTFDASTIDTSADPSTGAENPELTIIEFSDFECPYCERGYWTMELIMEEYGDRVNLVFKNYPLSFHANAQAAAEASECAYDQGLFWEYHDILFENQDLIDADYIVSAAEEIGLDMDTFNSCLESGEKTDLVTADMAAASSLGITGTPSFLVGNELVVGAQSFDTIAEIIDAQLA